MGDWVAVAQRAVLRPRMSFLGGGTRGPRRPWSRPAGVDAGETPQAHRRMEVDARRQQLGGLEARDHAQQLDRMGVSTETVDYVETTPPRSAAAVAAETALLAADQAGILPPHIRWFARGRGRVDERRVVRRGSPVRGFVDRMERPPTSTRSSRRRVRGLVVLRREGPRLTSGLCGKIQDHPDETVHAAYRRVPEAAAPLSRARSGRWA